MSEDSPSTAPERRSWLERLGLAFSGEPQTRADLVEILRDAQANGLLGPDTLKMLEGALSVSEQQVGDIMVPRSQMVSLPVEARFLDLMNLVVESGHSRFPVHGEDRDEILGILLAISALETVAVKGPDGENIGMLHHFALQINNVFPNENIVALILGFLSAIVDNVPLVAAVMGMYQEPLDHSIWHFIAYTAGTGGSMLIIGSAAGVAAMGMEHIDFLWYLRKVAWLAMLGYLAGAAVYLFLEVGF